MSDLFETKATRPRQAASTHSPLADRMRPKTFDELLGQDDIIGAGKPLRQVLTNDSLPSMILWGPPGSGKTTLARLVAESTGHEFVSFSAVTAGVKEVREVTEQARHALRARGTRTILFIDEIHRFNKAQQDAFLPHVETGTVVLIGATTENPSFECNSALLSRCRVFILRPLAETEIAVLVDRALADGERGLGSSKYELKPDARRFIAALANGDARVALNLLELSASAAAAGRPATGPPVITLDIVQASAQRKMLIYDRAGEEHYNIISALHKSMRGGDADAAIYWLARMLEAGEDPLYIARRLIRFASEDVGNADPQALAVAVAAKDAAHFVGMPECALALAQAATYLATAPKSNALYTAYSRVKQDIQKTQNLPVPLGLRNPVTELMKDSGYGKDYEYPHEKAQEAAGSAYEGGVVEQEYLPGNLKGRVYYEPRDSGFERELKKRIEAHRARRRKMRGQQ
ncbi:MAG: replication-associated recombination protein A [Planctomycetota bacterium]|nr:replication-associated recombination protein A [Planctomycetota bacterium]